MSYDVAVLADSISPEGFRIVTMEATFPRFILAEMNTHTLFSRNSASSRAIPPEKIVERIREHPFVPESFGKRVKGMGVGEALVGEDADQAKNVWLSLRDNAVEAAEYLIELDCDKSRINRLLEPFMWHTAIITATEWDNFFALRQPAEGDVPQKDFGAQPEMQIIARMMNRAWHSSHPRMVQPGEWGHLPLVTEGERKFLTEERLAHLAEEYSAGKPEAVGHGLQPYLPMISGGRCARVSFDTQHVYEDHDNSFVRAVVLRDKGHLSPHQHPARPFTDGEWRAIRIAQEEYERECDHQAEMGEPVDPLVRLEMLRRMEMCGNYRGWVPLRKLIDHEYDYGVILRENELGEPIPSGR